MTEKRKTHTWGMPVGCIPEKIIWGDTDFVETFRDDHALSARPLLSQHWRGFENLSGIRTRRICVAVMERAKITCLGFQNEKCYSRGHFGAFLHRCDCRIDV